MLACKFLAAAVLIVGISLGHAFPDSRNPNGDYELINVNHVVAPKPNIEPISTTRKPFIYNSPPPVVANSKTFAYDPLTKTWTVVKKNDPQPAEDALLWNQSNDKWLTNIARI